jgi:putative spermidine/putrescine transport system substrate-binding protein
MKAKILLAGTTVLFAAPVWAETLTINSFGGAYEDAHKTCVINPFIEATGAEVSIVTAYSADAFAQLRAQKDAPQFDVIHFSGGQEIVGAKEGLLAPVEPAKLENIGQLYDIAKPNLAAGEGPAYSIAPVGILANSEAGAAPASWAAMMKDADAGHMVLTDISNGYGMLGFLMMNQVAGGSMDDIQPGLDAVADLLERGAVIVSTSPEIQQEFAQNEAWIAPYAADYAYTLQQAGLPISFVNPEEGLPGSFITASLVAGRENTDLAYKFLDIEISKPAQECMAEALRYTPTNREAELPADVASTMVVGEDAVAKLIRFDPAVIEEKRTQWVDAWNSTIAK